MINDINDHLAVECKEFPPVLMEVLAKWSGGPTFLQKNSTSKGVRELFNLSGARGTNTLISNLTQSKSASNGSAGTKLMEETIF